MNKNNLNNTNAINTHNKNINKRNVIWDIGVSLIKLNFSYNNMKSIEDKKGGKIQISV